MRMNKIIAVTKWEYIEKVKTKAFLLSMIITPIFIIAMAVLPSLLAQKSDENTKRIGLVDLTDSLSNKVSASLETQYKLENGKSNYNIIPIPNNGETIDAIRKRVDKMSLEGKFETYIIIGKDVFRNGKCEYRGSNVSNIRDVERFERNIKNSISEIILTQKGIEPGILKEINKSIDLKSIKISAEGESKESSFLHTFFTSYIFIILLMMLIMLTGQMLIRSLVEEKSNRIVEILVSSCSPTELMAGKILGLSLLGLTQIVLWLIIGIGVSISFNFDLVSLDNLLLILVYFILGYLLYASVFVAIGSMSSTEQEAQQLTGYVSMILVLPIVLAFSAVQDPNSSLIRILTFIPFLTPTFMILRIPIQLPPLWEIGATLLLLLVSITAMTWIAGKIFRTGILMNGKKPSPKELLRWIREK
jgi:ABC-2 type transport system permease protein